MAKFKVGQFVKYVGPVHSMKPNRYKVSKIIGDKEYEIIETDPETGRSGYKWDVDEEDIVRNSSQELGFRCAL